MNYKNRWIIKINSENKWIAKINNKKIKNK